jgi:SAM-dependent methyltransferase
MGKHDGLVAMDPTDHAMVAAAMARLGFNGTWDRLLQGDPVTDGLDLADTELLVAAEVLAPDGDGFRLLRDEPPFHDGVILANGASAYLRRALQHAEGGAAGWDGQDADLVLRQGRASARIAGVLADWLTRMPSVENAFREGSGRFLDVGVGVAAISIALCRRFPGLTCVGLDVLPEVLAVARTEVAAHGFADRIELRELSVAALADDAAYDLAWLPQPFIPRSAFDAGVKAVLRAVRPGGWLVVPLMTPPGLESAFERAVVVHSAHVLGGGPIEVPEATDLLERSGFVDVAREDVGVQVVLRARRPTS